MYSLSYTYDLSKRTNLYAYASYADSYAFQRDAKDTAFAGGWYPLPVLSAVDVQRQMKEFAVPVSVGRE